MLAVLGVLLALTGCSGDDPSPKGSYGPSADWADAPAPAEPTGQDNTTAQTTPAPEASPEASSRLSKLIGGGKSCDEEDYLAETPLDRACITENLACGQTVKGHTGGGADEWNGDFYRSKFCAPVDSGTYEGPERVYFLPTPAEYEVRVTLDSPCEDLDLFLLTWSSADTCPGMGHAISSCEADTSSGGGKVLTQNIKNAYSYLVGVEGKRGKGAPFTLTVECEKLTER